MNRFPDQLCCMYATPVTSEELNTADVMMDGFLMDFMVDNRQWSQILNCRIICLNDLNDHHLVSDIIGWNYTLHFVLIVNFKCPCS